MNANTHLYVYTGGGAGLYMHTNTDTELTHVVSSAHIVVTAQDSGIALENIVFGSDVALSVQMDVEYLMSTPAPTMIDCPDCGIERWSDETGPCDNCQWLADVIVADQWFDTLSEDQQQEDPNYRVCHICNNDPSRWPMPDDDDQQGPGCYCWLV